MVFDLDGTLVDSRRDLAESANAVLVEFGCPTQPEDEIGRMVGDGAATLVARAFAAGGRDMPGAALARFLEIYNSRLLVFTRAYAGVPGLLDQLRRKAHLAVLTNKPLQPALEILEGLQLSQYFGGRVIGGDGPFPRKPDPSGLRHLIHEAGVTPEQTLMVGDSVFDWRTAVAGGVRTCLVRYGFGFEGFDVGQLGLRDAVVETPEEILRIL